MSKKKFKFIVIIFIIVIIAIFSYVFVKIVKDNDTTYSETETYKEFDRIVKAKNAKKYVVNNEEITDRDIILTEVLNEEKKHIAKETTIEKKVILQNIKSNGMVLNEKKDNYIKDRVEALKNDSEINIRYTEKEKNELIEGLAKKLYDDALIQQHKAEFIDQLADKTFFSDDKDVMEKYNKCVVLQDKWNNKEKMKYSELVEAREEVYNTYVQKLMSEAVIEYK